MRRSRRIRPWTKARVTYTAIFAGSLCLHPIQQGKTELLRSLQVAVPFFGSNVNNRSEPVVILRPVDHAEVCLVGPWLKITAVRQSAVSKQRIGPLLRQKHIGYRRKR
ncbi:hypothetical protein D3C75_932340 [compost metagenome]